MWVEALVIAAVVSVILFLWNNHKRDEYLSDVPGPAPWPVLGNILEYFGMDQADIFRKTRKFGRVYGDRYKLKVFRRRIVNITNPDDAEIVLSSTKNIQKSFIYTFLSSWLQEGLLLSYGAKWHARRKILTPAFHFNILKHYLSIIEDNSRTLVQDLMSETHNEKTNITPLMSTFALHSICETAMGTQLHADESQNALDYKSAIMKMGHKLLERLSTFWLHSEWAYKISPQGKRYEKLLQTIHKFPENVIKERRRNRNEDIERREKNKHNITKLKSTQHSNHIKGIDNVVADATEVVTVEEPTKNDDDALYMTKKKNRLAMLDLLLESENRGEIDMKGIKEEVDTFMFEGHDTSAMAMTFTLMLLANHEQVQDLVRAECDRVFGSSTRAATMSDLNDLRYLEACIKESLRLYPSVPFISRSMAEDMQLRDVLVKAGTICHIHIYDIHRRPELFPDPEIYKPDRFLAENLDVTRHTYGYIPFSAGLRNCIGQRFAMLEMKSVVSALVRNYKLRSVTKPEEIVFLADLVLRPRDPVYVQFKKR